MADQSDHLGVFGHGYTASAHPVATAVGLENLAIIEERGLVKNAAEIDAYCMPGWRASPIIHLSARCVVRVLSRLSNSSLTSQRSPVRSRWWGGRRFFECAHDHGLIIRAIGDSIAFCPPMIITTTEVDEMLKRFAATLEDIRVWIDTGMTDM